MCGERYVLRPGTVRGPIHGSSLFSLAQCREQVTHFLIHFLRPGHRLCNFAAQQLAVTLPQSVNSHAQGSFGHSEPSANVGISSAIAFTREEPANLPEQGSFAVAFAFTFQRIHG